MKYAITVLLILTLCSCDIMKKSSKTKTDTDFEEKITTKTTRLGDTVYYSVPQIRYRDSVVTTISRQGTILNTIYDKDGNISDINCISSKVDEFIEEQRKFNQTSKEKEKEKTEEFSDGWILYVMGGVVLLVAFFMFLMYKTVNKNTQAFNAILEKISK